MSKTAPAPKPTTAKATAAKATAAKATKAAPADAITEVSGKNAAVVIVQAGDAKLAFPIAKLKGQVAELAQVGVSIAALRAALGQPAKPVLANGATGRTAPHAAKAVADAKAKDAKAAPAAKAGKAPKAAPAPRAATAGDTYKSTGKGSGARAGTWRHYMVTLVQAHGSKTEAREAHAKGKFAGFTADFAGKTLDFGWMAKQGFIA